MIQIPLSDLKTAAGKYVGMTREPVRPLPMTGRRIRGRIDFTQV